MVWWATASKFVVIVQVRYTLRASVASAIYQPVINCWDTSASLCNLYIMFISTTLFVSWLHVLVPLYFTLFSCLVMWLPLKKGLQNFAGCFSASWLSVELRELSYGSSTCLDCSFPSDHSACFLVCMAFDVACDAKLMSLMGVGRISPMYIEQWMFSTHLCTVHCHMPQITMAKEQCYPLC